MNLEDILILLERTFLHTLSGIVLTLVLVLIALAVLYARRSTENGQLTGFPRLVLVGIAAGGSTILRVIAIVRRFAFFIVVLGAIALFLLAFLSSFR